MATFSSGVKCFRSFFIRSLRYLNGRTLSPFPAEAEHRDPHRVGVPRRTTQRQHEIAQSAKPVEFAPVAMLLERPYSLAAPDCRDENVSSGVLLSVLSDSAVPQPRLRRSSGPPPA